MCNYMNKNKTTNNNENRMGNTTQDHTYKENQNEYKQNNKTKHKNNKT